jgi:nucleoside phosphorylase
MILKGPAFSIGARDTPVYLSRKNYIRRFRWISSKLILLWDERGKRGWLINGTTALLHIVRAFLSHAKKDNFKSAFQFRDEDLQEAEAPFTADSAITVLLNPHNRYLKLYKEEDEDDDYLFKNQIDHVYNLLEKLIDHQADISRHPDSRLDSTPRRYLEGWDFEDVAIECPTIYPRVATIADPGKGWIDFIRAINAVTLVGRGFGDIIKPASRDHCVSWATLPTKKYYIASCVSDLDRLLKEAGNHSDGHALLCDDLIYHTPASVHMPCQCRLTPGQGHCEPVRTVIPAEMSKTLPFTNHPIQYNNLGAVIFGYNSHFPLIWGDTGSAQLGELQKMDSLSKAIEENVDSGFGSNSTESGLESPAVPQSESETEYSAMQSEIRPEAAKKVALSLPVTVGNNRYTRNDYTLGIICPLAKELKAVRALFDNVHDSLNSRSEDSYPYVLGDMAGHWVVTACLPEYGTNPAAAVAANMRFNFPSVRFCLLVGIAGGVPSKEKDVRLGDVVVSYPTGTSPGVIQYDLGKEEDGSSFQRTGSLQRPPLVLMAAINTLQSDLESPERRLDESLRAITDRLPDYKYLGQESNIPYQTACALCASQQASLGSCSHIQQRVPRTTTSPTVHYGVIASGNRVIKDTALRNQLAQEHGILCFEMEAAGVMNTLDCLVIRGISDYCDGQKNDTWQKYAAATAAAYAKLLLGFVPRGKRSGVESTEPNETMSLNKKRKLN